MSTPTINLVYWQPAKPIVRGLPFRRKVKNFGDVLSPVIVEDAALARGVNTARPIADATLIAIGSMMHRANDGDVIWGTGVNGAVDPGLHRFRQLDVRAVRGPLTASLLAEWGVQSSGVFGDPAILLPKFRPDLVELSTNKTSKVTYVPNLHDTKAWRKSGLRPLLDPTSPLEKCLRTIVTSELVIASSLHAVIIAQSFGARIALVRSGRESLFKYEDYFAGIGQELPRVWDSPDEVDIESIPVSVAPTKDTVDRLLGAFPADLWERRVDLD